MLAREPLLPVGERGRLQVERRGGVGDLVVVDRGDVGEVVLDGEPDREVRGHGSLSQHPGGRPHPRPRRAILLTVTRDHAAAPDHEPVPDTKDWTWVLERACPECGFDARSVRPFEVKNRVYANASAWRGVLADPGAAVRPAPGVWSPLEYACHVRDVHRVFAGRVRRCWPRTTRCSTTGTRTGPRPPARTATRTRPPWPTSWSTRPPTSTELYGSVAGAQWDRPGRRGNGSVFTVHSPRALPPARRRAPPARRLREAC